MSRLGVCYGFESGRYIPLVSVPEVSVACLKKKSWVCVDGLQDKGPSNAVTVF